MADETTRVTAQQFHAAEGTADWRVLISTAHAVFRTGDFATGLALVGRIGELAEEAGHHPDVDLTYPAVVVRLTTHDAGGLTGRDVALARRISEAARELGVDADPTAPLQTEIAIDVLDRDAVLPFWAAVLGFERVQTDGYQDVDLRDPRGRGATIWFQQMDEPRPQRNRIHLDVWVAPDAARERVAAVLAAGGTLLSDAEAPSFWVLADPEGNEACVCTCLDRDR
ncbi:VOC family protein [Cellulomonas sp. PhB143]|uniref:VOC family protein n=1 Tax=Cellulomonas sp. PhB143 TaxID=2485186 RepID=UPI000F496790|nr:VOC family protein [Cellulomonas sp. PhB143]ROS73520.1 4a-hydroxytetrahydrobiopterin dehydratase [Cellulomonas sp. PhB143]